MLFRVFFASAAVVLVVDCQTPAHESLASNCQSTECVCALEKASVIEKSTAAPVLWEDDGDAHCVEGYVLQTKQAHAVAEAKRPLQELD